MHFAIEGGFAQTETNREEQRILKDTLDETPAKMVKHILLP
jgi:hypothetical protein